MKRSQPLEFLEQAEKDPMLSARVTAAVERGGKVTAEEIMQIAKEFGYTFTRAQFEKEVKRAFATQFAAVEAAVAATSGNKPKPPKPLLSTCARGCLSYSQTWHPTETTRP